MSPLRWSLAALVVSLLGIAPRAAHAQDARLASRTRNPCEPLAIVVNQGEPARARSRSPTCAEIYRGQREPLVERAARDAGDA